MEKSFVKRVLNWYSLTITFEAINPGVSHHYLGWPIHLHICGAILFRNWQQPIYEPSVDQWLPGSGQQSVWKSRSDCICLTTTHVLQVCVINSNIATNIRRMYVYASVLHSKQHIYCEWSGEFGHSNMLCIQILASLKFHQTTLRTRGHRKCLHQCNQLWSHCYITGIRKYENMIIMIGMYRKCSLSHYSNICQILSYCKYIEKDNVLQHAIGNNRYNGSPCCMIDGRIQLSGSLTTGIY